MNRQDVIRLFKAIVKPEVGKFTSADAAIAANNALQEFLGIDLETISAREIREHKNDIFSIYEEVVEELVPQKLEERIGSFAEIKTYDRDAEVSFTIKNVGGQRIKQYIVPGARGGIYRARKLDKRSLIVDTEVETISYQMSLEDLLLNPAMLNDLVAIITEGFVEKVYFRVIAGLKGLNAGLPANNKATSSGTTVNYAELDKVIRTVSSYGTPVIVGFQSKTRLLHNAVTVGTSTFLSQEELLEIKNNGRVPVYKGTAIIELPNYFVDATNSAWVFEENQLFVLPVDEKPVKVALKGDLTIVESNHPSGGAEYNAHRLLGVAILFNNSVGIYTFA